MPTIKELRQSCGLTQQQFADKFHIPKRSVENWDEGKREPPAYIPYLIEQIITLERHS